METELISVRRAVQYELPQNWIRYDFSAIASALVEAKAAVLSLTTMPYQRNWIEALQEMQLKREIAGTSRIEGADLTDRELDVALKPDATTEELLTRSQRQAHAAMKAYKWISQLPNDRDIDSGLICEVHRRIVIGCDDDHCEPATLRRSDYNVTFGIPRHRGCEGGEPCKLAFANLVSAIREDYPSHDLLIQALALHYHFAAMHPFMDGNGRTARALEALVLQRAGLTDKAFIAMSNYYYDEKNSYLLSLSQVREKDHDLTPFILFALKGVALQCHRLYAEIRKHMERALFRNMMYDLFNRLESTRKRVIKDRQIALLKILLEVEKIDWYQFVEKARVHYKSVANVNKTLIRDIRSLIQLRAIEITKIAENKWDVGIRPQWPQEITESDFFEKIKKMPKGKTYPFLP
jgi:Fic family protein